MSSLRGGERSCRLHWLSLFPFARATGELLVDTRIGKRGVLGYDKTTRAAAIKETARPAIKWWPQDRGRNVDSASSWASLLWLEPGGRYSARPIDCVATYQGRALVNVRSRWYQAVVAIFNGWTSFSSSMSIGGGVVVVVVLEGKANCRKNLRMKREAKKGIKWSDYLGVRCCLQLLRARSCSDTRTCRRPICGSVR